MKIVLKLLFAISIFLAMNGFAQNAEIDSLQNSLRTAKEDTNKVNTLNRLCWKYSTIDTRKAFEFGRASSMLAQKITYSKGLADAYNNIGNCYKYAGKYDSAQYSYNSALSIFEKLNHYGGINSCYKNIGNIYKRKGQYPAALNYFFKILRRAEQKSDSIGIAESNFSIGLVHSYQAKFNISIVFYKKALRIAERINDRTLIADINMNIGGDYAEQNLFDKAIVYYKRSLEEFEEQQDKHNIALMLGNIGQIYSTKHDYVTALNYGFKSLKALEEIGNKPAVGVALNTIAAIYYDMKKYPEAIEQLNKAVIILKETDNLEDLKYSYFNLSKCNAGLNNYAQAYKYHLLYTTIKDTVFNKENTRQIAEINTKYETEKKDKELVEKDSEIKQKSMQRNAFIIGFLLVGLLAFFVYRSYIQKQKANEIISAQKLLVEEKNKEITDSITYAKRIQNAILPSVDLIYKSLADSFILYKPKDVVSGDFYAFAERDDEIMIAAVDCTGHGVPGAFMSMIGHDILSQIIVEKGVIKPSEILGMLNKGIRKALKQDNNETKDGMDIALCCFNLKTMQLQYAGANRPLWIVENSQNLLLKEVKATKASIGGHTPVVQEFENNVIQLQKNDTIYLSSDGYADQFGGPDGKKMMTKRYKEMLVNIQSLSMKEQEIALNKAFEEWKGKHEQVDDVLVLGVRV